MKAKIALAFVLALTLFFGGPLLLSGVLVSTPIQPLPSGESPSPPIAQTTPTPSPKCSLNRVILEYFAGDVARAAICLQKCGGPWGSCQTPGCQCNGGECKEECQWGGPTGGLCCECEYGEASGSNPGPGPLKCANPPGTGGKWTENEKHDACAAPSAPDTPPPGPTATAVPTPTATLTPGPPPPPPDDGGDDRDEEEKPPPVQVQQPAPRATFCQPGQTGKCALTRMDLAKLFERMLLGNQ